MDGPIYGNPFPRVDNHGFSSLYLTNGNLDGLPVPNDPRTSLLISQNFLDRFFGLQHREVTNIVRHIDQKDHAGCHGKGTLYRHQRGCGGIKHVYIQFPVYRDGMVGPFEHRQCSGQEKGRDRDWCKRFDEQGDGNSGA